MAFPRATTSLLARLLFLAELIVLVLIARQWAYVTTYRLDLDRAVANTGRSVAIQQFDLAKRRVVPRIVTREPARLVFQRPTSSPLTLRLALQPAAAAVNYVVAWRADFARTVLASGRSMGHVAITQPLPAGDGVLELETDGSASWVDPILVREMHVGRHLVALLLLLVASWFVSQRLADADHASVRLARFKGTALVAALAIAVIGCEAALRALGDRAPAGVLALRHDLGEDTPDERWEDSAPYGRRLRPRVDAENAWQYGDIVRMGFVPASVSPGVWHRFQFQTDTEGFRNAAVRERPAIAALGDSFTDGLTVPVDETWPAQLQKLLGVAVQNYGTAGFGPQQELRVLRDFVLPHHPSRVVLAYFAGNDIFDAERFDRFEHGEADDRTLGWPLKNVFTRADTWFVTSAAAAGADWLSRRQQPYVLRAQEIPSDRRIEARAPFDRGLFTLQVHGQILQWAFMPPYLNTMNFSQRELSERVGWTITRDAILAMRDASRRAGADFLVIFLPFKAQVYWPLLEQSLAPEVLRRALAFSLDGNGRRIDTGVMRANRLAQNAMVRDLCESAGIPLLDTTPVLQQRVEAGENMYFPDESHLNERGLLAVAEALGEFLNQP